MYQPKNKIPQLRREVVLKNIKPFTKEHIASRFTEAQNMLIFDLLEILLDREPNDKDYDNIERVQSFNHDGEDVYYCGVKIGKLVIGGDKDMFMSLLKRQDIYAYFIPEGKSLED
ncbi:hypothetical protein [uncultured Draconibacterium sp.]|uniref:hypothetical protein n=1 Tax=uncultured Draconibacterium sp. TaxID=1573823 RepID=UPI0032167813